MKYIYVATFAPFADGSGYECRVPDIPHCVTSGSDIADAMAMIQDCASVMLTVCEDDGIPIPAPRQPGEISAPEGGFCSVLAIDTDRYRMMNDTHTVKKSVSIPAWMDIMAQRRGISLSQALQETLRIRLGV